jgi:hypothetical protein
METHRVRQEIDRKLIAIRWVETLSVGHANAVLVRSGLHFESSPFANAGQKVVIANGPLRNVEGILVRSEGDYRLAVGVSLLQRSVLVELGAGTEIVRSGTKTATDSRLH